MGIPGEFRPTAQFGKAYPEVGTSRCDVPARVQQAGEASALTALGQRSLTRKQDATPASSAERSAFFSDVLRAQTRPTSYSGQHPRSDLHAIVKCENKVRPSGTLQHSM